MQQIQPSEMTTNARSGVWDPNNRRKIAMRILTLSIVAILVLGALYIVQTQELHYDAGIEAHKRGHYEIAMYEFETRAMRGDPTAQLYVGFMYAHNQGVKKNLSEAIKWYKKAAMQDEVNAQYYLGEMYWNGEGVDANRDSAKYWYEKAVNQGDEKAANQGLAKAQFYLGEMYEKGEGFEANLDLAKYWYERAADKGYSEGQYRLSLLYLDNFKLNVKNVESQTMDTKSVIDDLASDLALFLYWLERAANQGHAKAQFQKGVIHEKWSSQMMKLATITTVQKKVKDIFSGKEIEDIVIYEKDFKKAEYWYEKAANQGLMIAQNELAVMYDNCIKIDDSSPMKHGKISNKEDYELCKQLGDEIKKKAEKIARLYLGAAQQGDAAAQYNLGLRFEEGLTNDEGEIFIKKNDKEAYYWYSLAASKRKRTWENYVKERIIDKDKIEADQNLKKEIEKGVKRTEKYLKNDNEKREIESLVNSWKPKKSRYGYGTGFYIKNEYILTNAHVVCSNIDTSGQCDKYDELRIPFQRVDSIIAIDVNVDLALLHVDSGANENPVGKLRGTNIHLGEKVAVFGYPQSHILSYLGNFTEGIVSGLSGAIKNPQASNLFQYTAPIQSGNSGGPVFDDAGNVIGVVVSRFENYIDIEDEKIKIENFQNINFAINLNTIKEFLDKTEVPYEPTTNDSLMAWEEIAKRAKMFTVPVLGFTNKSRYEIRDD